MLNRIKDKAFDKNIEDINPVMDKEKLLEHQENVRKISVSDEAKKYIVDIVDKLRKQDENIEFGPSPRATIALLNVAKAVAYLKCLSKAKIRTPSSFIYS